MRRLRTLAPLCLMVAAACFCALAAGLGLRINLSPSLPLGLYRLTAAPIAHGSLVAACLPQGLASLARRDRLLRSGTCPGGASPVLKLVGALGGDLVTVTADRIRVNGAHLQPSAPRFDRRGRPIQPLPRGAYRLQELELWLYAPHPRSWDSRYFGPVSRDSVLASVRPLFTRRPLPSPPAIPSP